jgi:hypothetical protein
MKIGINNQPKPKQESHFIGVYEDAASSDYCNRMVSRFDELEKRMSAWKGEDANNGLKNRKDFSFMFEIDAKDLVEETNKLLDICLAKYIDEYPGIGMLQFYSNSIKVQRTPPKGGFHSWHCENGYGDGSHARCLVWSIYLNDIPDGEGETEFLEYGIKVKPKKGTIAFFPAAWTHTHRGNPVYSCDKYIATGWYYISK